MSLLRASALLRFLATDRLSLERARESTVAQAELAFMGELRGSVDFFRIPIRYRLACLGIVWFDH